MNKKQVFEKMDKIAKSTCCGCGGCCCNCCFMNLGYHLRDFTGRRYATPIGNAIHRLIDRANKKFKTKISDFGDIPWNKESKDIREYINKGMYRIAKSFGVTWSKIEITNKKGSTHMRGFGGPEGCSIPREMRSYTCLSYICSRVAKEHYGNDDIKARREYESMAETILGVERKNGYLVP